MNVCFRNDFRCFRDGLKLSLVFARVFKLVYGFLLRRFVLLPPLDFLLLEDEDLVDT